ncbi:MAG: SpoIIE family protein phosphatase [Acidobacteria bacterium]|nr:SpoIIE family protein phosphatase [Acidobacteriota bacterium]
MAERDELLYLIESSKLINSTLEYDQLLPLIMELTTRALHAEAACLFLVDEPNGQRPSFNEFFSWKLDAQTSYSKDFCRELALRVLDGRRPLLSGDIEGDFPFVRDFQSPQKRPIRTLVCTLLERGGVALGVLEALNKRDGEVFETRDLEIFEALADHISTAITNTRLYRKAVQESKEKHLLLEVGRKISAASLNLNEVLTAMVDGLREVIDYDAAAIFLIDGRTQQIQEKIASGYEPSGSEKISLTIGEGVVGWVVKTGKAALVPDVSREPRYVNARPSTRSEIAVPLFSKGKVIGAFNLESDRLNAYKRENLELLEAFASQAAVSIELARAHQESLEKKHWEEELKIARQIQKTFLPTAEPDIPSYDLAGINIPSEEVGGDYYDFIAIATGQWGLVVGDVAGKGIPASLIMAAFRASLIAEVRNNYSVSVIMAKVNRLLYESTQRHEMVTACYGVLDAPRRVLTYANAGHPPPLLVHARGDYELLTEGGVPLGCFPRSQYAEQRIQLLPGDVLALYTDGIVESFSRRREEFGIPQLAELVVQHRGRPAREILGEVQTAVRQFVEPAPQQDDLTLVILKALPQP